MRLLLGKWVLTRSSYSVDEVTPWKVGADEKQLLRDRSL